MVVVLYVEVIVVCIMIVDCLLCTVLLYLQALTVCEHYDRHKEMVYLLGELLTAAVCVCLICEE